MRGHHLRPSDRIRRRSLAPHRPLGRTRWPLECGSGVRNGLGRRRGSTGKGGRYRHMQRPGHSCGRPCDDHGRGHERRGWSSRQPRLQRAMTLRGIPHRRRTPEQYRYVQQGVATDLGAPGGFGWTPWPPAKATERWQPLERLRGLRLPLQWRSRVRLSRV